MARNFPGTATNYFRVTDSNLDGLGGTALTVSVWCRPTGAPNGDIICAKEDGAGAQFDLFAQSGVFQGRIRDGAGFDTVIGTILPSTINWQHIVLRKNGTGANALQIYYNSVLDGQVTSNKTIQSSTDDFYIGNRGQNDSAWNGPIAEVAIWTIALTPTEIGQLYAGALANTIQTSSLKGYWPLCGITNPELDFSGNNVHASLTGSAPFAIHPFNNSICVLDRYAPPSHVGGRGAA